MSVALLEIIDRGLRRQARAFSLVKGQVHVWSVGLDLFPDEVEGEAQLVTDAELSYGRGFAHAARGRSFTLRRILLRQLLARYGSCQALDIAFKLGPRGKPAALGPAAGIEFNVSSSGTRVAFAFSPGIPVGLDVEELRWREGLEEVAGRFFNPVERALLAAAPQVDRQRQFFRIWTRKEAQAKLSGDGLAGFEARDALPSFAQVLAHELPLTSGFVGHLALPQTAQIKVMQWAPDVVGNRNQP